jgi:hypothetical protein
MALPSPTTAWKLTKWLLKSAEYVVPPAVAYLEGRTSASETVADPRWVRVVHVFQRSTPSGTSEDFAQFKLDLVNITGGAIDNSWTSGDVAAVEAALATFWTTLRPEVQSIATLKERRYYAMGFNPADPGPGLRTAGAGAFLNTGPPFNVVTVGTAGTGVGSMPYQVATSCTFKTAWPQHWGRAYVPNPWHSAGLMDTYGRLVAAHRTVVADAFHDLFDTLATGDFLAAVPVTQIAKQTSHALLGVESVVVDDVPDVIRRRRPKMAAARTIGA